MARLVINNLDGVREFDIANIDGQGRAFKIPPAGGVIVLTTSEYEKAVKQLTSFVARGHITYTVQTDTEPQRAICATTAPTGLSGLLTIDGVVLTKNDVVLVKEQVDQTQNGLYVAGTGLWTRLNNLGGGTILTPGLMVIVTKGVVNGDQIFLLVNDSTVAGTDVITFTSIAALGPPPPVVIIPSGWLSIVDVAVVGGLASSKVYDDPPNNTIIQSASISGLNLNVTVKSSAPHVTVGGTPFTLAPDVGGGYYQSTVNVTVAGAGPLVAQLTTSDGALGASDTVTLAFQAAPTITSLIFIGGYPGAQTELKAGDTFQVQGTTDLAATGVEVQDFGAGIFQAINFGSTTSFIITITIADRGTTPQALIARMRAKNVAGAFGANVDTTNNVTLNNRYPTVTFGTKTYPVGQGALKNSETADIAVTTANLDSILYDSPNGDLSIASPTVIGSPKTVTRIAGSYNVSTNNLRSTATRAANNAVTVSQTVVAIANVAPTVDITVPAARLRSGGNNGTVVQGHAVTVVANQQLFNAPSITAGGGTLIGGFTGGPSSWTQTLNVHDNDTKGAYSFTTLVATGLSGITQNTINSGSNYTLGGFVQRALTFAAFSQSTTLGVGVVTYAKLQAGIFTATNQTAVRNAIQGDHSNLTNQYTVDSIGNVGPTNLWWNDAAAAGSNSGGTAGITAVEEIV